MSSTFCARVEGGQTPRPSSWGIDSEYGTLRDVLVGPIDHFSWQPGNAEDLARVLLATCAGDLEALKGAAQSRFERVLSWDALGARTVAEYRALPTR